MSTGVKARVHALMVCLNRFGQAPGVLRSFRRTGFWQGFAYCKQKSLKLCQCALG